MRITLLHYFVLYSRTIVAHTCIQVIDITVCVVYSHVAAMCTINGVTLLCVYLDFCYQ